MTPIHHSAVAAAWGPLEDAEYRPFAGYGGHGQHYARVAPFRGHSNIPHHVAVESREDGELNGRIFYANSARASRREAERLRTPRTFRMDARHSAIAEVPEVTIIRLPDTPARPERQAARTRPSETPAERRDQLVGAL
jgi:hypothetical protein